MNKYNPQKVEAKWQEFWAKNKTFQARDFSKKPSAKSHAEARHLGGSATMPVKPALGGKKFILVEFPYPSGAGLHMGHLRPYVAADVYARFHRMRGFETLFPMGWDAFGLPAENYAIKMGVHPSITTKKNIANAKKQMQSWGLSFDWSREINTTDPEYYKWTQWLFLQFYKKGLAFESTGLINWCPKDKTGLANEEVIDGKCERCGTVVEKKELRQWYLKITDYAEKLLEGLKNLPQWPEPVKLQQENWIGKSTGAEIEFELKSKKENGEILGFDSQLVPLVINKSKTVTFRLSKKDLKVGDVVPVADSGNGKVFGLIKITKIEESILKNISLEYPGHEKYESKLERLKIFSKYYNREVSEDEPVFIYHYIYFSSSIKVFTTRPDTIFGATYLVVAPEHPLIKDQESSIENYSEIQKYLEKTKEKAETERTAEGGEKTGVEIKGIKAINPATKQEIPVWVADYVLGHYGTGAVMAVPAHDKRDFEFYKKFNLTIKQVISHKGTIAGYYNSGNKQHHPQKYEDEWNDAYSDYGTLIESGAFNNMESAAAIPKMAAQFGKLVTHYKLRDWVFSRQRYWGEPIPLIHCEDCGVVPVPEKDLPVKLPNVKKYEPTGTGESPLADILKWVKTKCPKCGKLAWRETNTMPQWAGSSWYWLRYTDPKNKKQFSALNKQKYWTPVDVYFGGMEHTTLHLLYSRFWNLFMYDQGLVSEKEPYKMRKPHGIILGPDGEKMSKSRGNVVDPQGVVKQYGADVLRMYEMFLGPHEAMVAFNDKGIVGVARFLDRVWNWVNEIADAPHAKNQETRTKKQNKSKIEIKKFVLLHGKGGSPSSGVLPWLKKELESKGFKVEVPTLPNPEAPNDVEQTEYVLKNCKIDESTAILGHSFGGIVALRLLEKGVKAGQVVLAATPFSGKFLDNKERPTVSEALKKGFDFKIITKNCKNFVALYDTSDYVVPMSDGQSFADGLKIQLVKVKSEKPHFVGEREPNVFTALIPETKTEVKDTEKVERELNKLIKKITQDIENFSFNTCISAFMEFHNAIKDDFITLESVKKFLTVLYPFAPHISEELGQLVSKSAGKQVSKTLQTETWPSFDASLIIDKEVEMVVQINGKVRGKIKVPSGSLEDFVKTEVQKLEPVKQSLVGESIKRVIFVKDRLINLVI